MASKTQNEHVNNPELIEAYISLKKESQEIYFALQEKNRENIVLKEKLTASKAEMDEMKMQIDEMTQQINDYERNRSSESVSRENKLLLAKVKQLRRSSTAPEIRRSSVIQKVKPESSEEFEVEDIINHRGKKGNREFLVRWKNFDSTHDCWLKTSSLKCPMILKNYVKNKKIVL